MADTPAGMPGMRILVGPSLDPAPQEVADNLRAIRVAERADGRRWTVRLRFALGGPSLDAWGRLLAAGTFDPGTRLVLLSGREDEPVLFDGVVTGQELAVTGPGGATLELTGEDLTVLMDLDEVVAQYPTLPAHVRAEVIIDKYAVYGVQPNVTPAPFLDVPTPTDRIPTQAETDYRYVRRLAEDVGYLFGLRPGPQPGASVATWGPPNRAGTRQPALTVDGGAVRQMRFAFAGLERTAVTAMVLDPATKTLIHPAPDVHVVRPQLAARLAAALRHRALPGMAKRTPIGAAASLLGAEAMTADPVTATGVVDVDAYGQPLRTDAPVVVGGAGAAYDGTYWVSHVTHRIDERGYAQRFVLRRDGLGGA